MNAEVQEVVGQFSNGVRGVEWKVDEEEKWIMLTVD